MKKEQLLIIFAKNPELGKVKTRLAKDIGDKKALKAYSSLLKNIFSAFQKTRFDVKVYFTLKSNKLPKRFKLKPQKGKDLGKRMLNAFKDNLEKYGKVIIIGTDCPFVGKRIVNTAFKALDKYKIVLGPSEDGGYYLMGLGKPRRLVADFQSLFQNITWSTHKVLSQTLKQCKLLGIKPYILKKLYDIDTIKEYKRWKRKK